MGERTSYSPGTFSWADLTTTDLSAAKTFYGGLFGWEATDTPVGDESIYSMMSIGGKQVGAIAPQPPQQRDAGAPPVWNSYVTVESADGALARAKELGATVHADAFDVMDAGRMGVIQDPQGAYVLVWEPKSHIGADLVNAHGALAWNELATGDIDGSGTFYSDLFGWTLHPMEGMDMPYSVIHSAAGASNGGIRAMTEQEPVPYWLVYFGTDDIDATVAKAQELGGQVYAGPMPIGVGSIAILADPQGAVFALFAGDFDE